MPFAPNLAVLGQIALFHGLTHEQLSAIAALLHHQSFAARTTLLTQEHHHDAVSILLSGTVKICFTDARGNEVMLNIIGAGEILGEINALDGQGHTSSVVALEASALLWMRQPAFLDCLQTMPGLALNLARILSRRLRRNTLHIQSLSTNDIPGRIARQLLNFAEQYGCPGPNGVTRIPLRLTQSDLADLTGASRVRVNQVLAAFTESKYISVDKRHHITVYNPIALARRCQ